MSYNEIININDEEKMKSLNKYSILHYGILDSENKIIYEPAFQEGLKKKSYYYYIPHIDEKHTTEVHALKANLKSTINGYEVSVNEFFNNMSMKALATPILLNIEGDAKVYFEYAFNSRNIKNISNNITIPQYMIAEFADKEEITPKIAHFICNQDLMTEDAQPDLKPNHKGESYGAKQIAFALLESYIYKNSLENNPEQAVIKIREMADEYQAYLDSIKFERPKEKYEVHEESRKATISAFRLLQIQKEENAKESNTSTTKEINSQSHEKDEGEER